MGILRALLLIAAAAVPVLLGASSRAESSLRFEMPDAFGQSTAVVYDDAGRPIGTARMAMRRQSGGAVRAEIETKLETGEVQSLRAELEPVSDGRELVLASQDSRSIGRNGELIVGMQIDHRRGRAVCTDSEQREVSLELSPGESIANVPVNLVLLPLARGAVQEVEFQFLLCRGEPRVLDASAALTRRLDDIPGHRDVAEIRYTFEVAGFLSTLIRPFLPIVVFWMAPDAPIPWMGHRMPIFPKGPTVTVLREGIALAELSR